MDGSGITPVPEKAEGLTGLPFPRLGYLRPSPSSCTSSRCRREKPLCENVFIKKTKRKKEREHIFLPLSGSLSCPYLHREKV